jgi:hypothetical protein
MIKDQLTLPLDTYEEAPNLEICSKQKVTEEKKLPSETIVTPRPLFWLVRIYLKTSFYTAIIMADTEQEVRDLYIDQPPYSIEQLHIKTGSKILYAYLAHQETATIRTKVRDTD